jgi:chromate transporter
MSNHNEKNSPDTPQPTSVGISRREAFWFWFKLGFISFGGPAGQIAMMHTELVDKRRWISDKRFLHALNFCMVLPGPEAQQLATYLGWLMHRTWGGIVAGTLFILPSLLLIVSLSWVYMAYGDTKIVAGLFYGIKPAVTVLVIQASYRIGSRTLHNPWLWTIAVLSFLALFVFDLPFPFARELLCRPRKHST